MPRLVRQALAPATNAASAQAFTNHLAHSHYENFTVVSVLVPKHLRQDFCNIYAFCRIADDLGDELADCELSLRMLSQFRQQTQACYAGECQNNVLLALSETIRRHDIPLQPFVDLIDAFEQDQRVTRYDTFDQVIDYCRRSADPVGRLVLYLCGYRDEQRQRLSDKICTALQLANFWQDVRRDIDARDRIYLPRESMNQFHVTEQQIKEKRCDGNYRSLIRFEVDRTEKLFDEGEGLLPLLRPEVRGQIALFGAGGRAVLTAIRKQNYDTLSRRPSISKLQKGRLLISVMASRILRGLGRAA
ncbi:MAG TPA: squalene synthase HpnC [Tepidisphaeraceae bacterium]